MAGVKLAYPKPSLHSPTDGRIYSPLLAKSQRDQSFIMTTNGNAVVGSAEAAESTGDGIDASELCQELRREMTLFKTLAISFSTMTLFTGITPLYRSSLQYGGPAPLVWGWVVVSFFTAFVAIAMS